MWAHLGPLGIHSTSTTLQYSSHRNSSVPICQLRPVSCGQPRQRQPTAALPGSHFCSRLGSCTRLRDQAAGVQPHSRDRQFSQRSSRTLTVAAAGTRTKRPLTKVQKAAKKAEEAPQRLSKVLAAAGVASRRAAEQLIFAGDVKVNGKVVTLPQTLASGLKDKIEVKGRQIAAEQPKKFYFAVNKPKGFACTNASPEGEGGSRLVVDLLADWIARWKKEHPKSMLPPRLFTVGRLDVQSVGLIFVTNDGKWAQEVMHPSSELTKEYIATVDKPASRRHLQVIAEGCEVDGVMVQPTAVAIDNSDPAHGNRKIRIVVAEGRNREVRELIGNAGLEVTFLKRIRVGGFKLPPNMNFGQFRALKPNEVRRTLDRGAQML